MRAATFFSAPLLCGALLVGAALPDRARAATRAAAEPAPLVGDVVHGRALLQKAGEKPRLDGAWLNASSDEQALSLLERGAGGFPRIRSDNVLDRWDALAALRAHNTDLRDLLMGADSVLIMDTVLDDHAVTRLTEQAKLQKPATTKRRVFGLYRVGDDDTGLRYVGEKEHKRRDRLKQDTKVGYVVFLPLRGFAEGKHEVAFAVDRDIQLQDVVVRAPDGSTPVELNQAADRFVGQGKRGQYEPLQPKGKSLRALEGPLSEAFLLAMEAVYMFEVQERDYFAFDD